jgi:DNA primase
MRFPQPFIDDLRRQADIVRLISDYVPLKKKGANWMACCPFHREKTPSFAVNPAKEIFYCFGCQKGGSIFNFVMEMERVSFPEAVRIVAEKTGVPLPAMEEDRRHETRRREADDCIMLNTWALEWWEQQLLGGGAEARAALTYLAGRGITDETRAAFRLGYAPDSWDALTAHLKKRGATLSQIERSGLVVRREAGGFYDRFRGRVIFPVMDAQGRPVAFGGRTLQPDGEPKYLNSPETAVYTKGRHLYGLHLTRDEIRRRGFAILVEGYLDLVIPYQFGVRNIVASLGTALTPDQVKLLGRFARKVVVNYDGDRAGLQAAKRALETFLAEDFEVKVLVLPDNADPDQFIKTKGVTEYNERRSKALPYIQFILDQAVRGRDLHHPADKAAAVEEVLPSLRAVKNMILKREYFDIAMSELRIDDPALRKDLWHAVQPGAASSDSASQKVVRAAAVKPTDAERILLELLVHDAELRREILPDIEAADYSDLPTAAVFGALKQAEETGAELDLSGLSEQMADDAALASFVPLLLMSEPRRGQGEVADHAREEALSCLRALRLMRIDRRLKEVAAEIQAAQRDADQARLDQLVTEQVDLSRRRNGLLSHPAGPHNGL